MGRSEKKIKSDRINVLKKKYDAYLEEDKKRKERNEYILEKLDKMRCSTALVQVRQKPYVIEENRNTALHDVSKQTLENLNTTTNEVYFRTSEIPYKHMDETVNEMKILQEISKKYILIPKTRTAHINNNAQFFMGVQAEKDENNDWKSKYDILKQLKEQEKVDSSNAPLLKEADIQAEVNKLSKTNPGEDCKNLHNYCNKQVSDEVGITIDNLGQKTDIQEVNNLSIMNDNFDEVIDGTISKQALKNFSNIPAQQDKLDKQKLPDSIEQNVSEYYPVPDNENIEIQNEYSPGDLSNTQAQHIQQEIAHTAVDNEQDYYLTLDKENSIETINPNDVVGNNDVAYENKTDAVKEFQYPIENVDVHDFAPQEHQPVMNASGDCSNDNPQIISELAYAEKDKRITGNSFDPIVVSEDTGVTEDTDLSTGVETFAENIDGYYDEQVNETYAYNEESGVENFNTEYSAHNEDYNHEEYTAYYEGAQTDQTNAIETSENEAVLQQYDQTYQQQYDVGYNPQNYQQGYEQQYAGQNYEQNEYTRENEAEQTQLDTMQYDSQGDTLQYVEQIMDKEEGYIVEKQNATIEKSDVEKSLNKQPSAKAADQAETQ